MAQKSPQQLEEEIARLKSDNLHLRKQLYFYKASAIMAAIVIALIILGAANP